MSARAPTKHEEFQGQVLQLATMMGWKHLHVRRTVGRGKKWVTATNVIGWPDLLLWNPRVQGICALELKIPPDEPTPEQVACLQDLAKAGIPVMVAMPDMIDGVQAFLAQCRRNLPSPLAPIGVSIEVPLQKEG